MKIISIIVPMYNVAQYIEKCIESLYKQGINEKDFEVVIVDDESTDNSIEIASKNTQFKTNVKIIAQKNKGLGGARNTGLKNASGKYILFLDSDDWYVPNVLNKLIKLATINDLDILEFAAQGIHPNGNIEYHAEHVSTKVLDGMTYYNENRYLHSACNKLYNRNFLEYNNLYFSEKIYIEDFEFNTRVFSMANRVLATDLLVAQFLQSPNSITRNSSLSNRNKIIEDLIIVLEKTKKAYTNHSLSNQENAHKYFNERLAFLNVNIFYQLFKNRATFLEIEIVKNQLIESELFYVNHEVYQRKKNWFRIILLKNFWLFKITQRLLLII